MTARAQTVVRMSSDSAKLFADLEKLIAKEKQVDDEREKNSRRQNRRGQTFQQGIRSQISSLGQLAAGYVGINAAMQAGIQLLREEEQIREQAAQRNRQRLSGQGQLLQISQSREQFEALSRGAERMSAGAGIDIQRAQQNVVALQNAGQFQDLGLYTELARTRMLLNVEQAANAVSQIQGAIPGSGDARRILNLGVHAASFTPSTMDQVLAGGARAGASAYRLGLGTEDILSAVASISKPIGGAEIAGTRVNAMLRVLARRGGFEGMSLDQMLTAVEERGAAQTLAGSDEAMEAFTFLTANRERYRRIRRGATGRDTLTQRAGWLESDFASRISIEAMQNEQQRAIDRTGLGSEEQVWQDYLEAERERGFLPRILSSTLGRAAAFVEGPRRTMMRNMARQDVREGQSELVRNYVDHVSGSMLMDAAQQLSRAAENLNNGSSEGLRAQAASEQE